jgi:hypothetical protein
MPRQRRICASNQASATDPGQSISTDTYFPHAMTATLDVSTGSPARFDASSKCRKMPA